LKPFVLLLTALMLPALSFAQQALVLTEIEQIQEKVWYLQRDLAAQQKVLDKQQGVLTQLADKVAGIENSDTTQVTALQEMLTDQGQSLQGLESALQSFEKTLSTLQENLRQQQAAQSAAEEQIQAQQTAQSAAAEQIRAQQAALQDLKNAFGVYQKETGQTREAIDRQLTEIRDALTTLREGERQRIDQIGLWVGGGALGLAILLTIGNLIWQGKSRSSRHKQRTPYDHEL
jgi:chromosome segregation ATPase